VVSDLRHATCGPVGRREGL